MKQNFKGRAIRSSVGASMLEYVVIAGLLMSVFAIGFLYLQNSSRARGEASMQTVTDMVPCDNQALSGDACL